MLDRLAARVKVTVLLVLFFAPVAIAAWDLNTRNWLNQDHRYEAASEAGTVIASNNH